MRRALLSLMGFAACGAELPPRGQVVLHIDTDAPISPANGFGLFDTLRVDVFLPDESEPCATCTRTFTVRSEQFAARAVTFGIPEKPRTAGYRVRVRLYPSRVTTDATSEALDPPMSVLDTFAALPVVEEEGLVHARLLLRVDEVGFRRGSRTAPIALEPGSVTSSQVDTWPGAKRVPCQGEPREGEVCVPGGAFWMGNPAAQELDTAFFPLGTTRTRLVRVSPFFMGRDLVTVAEFRAMGGAALERRPNGDGTVFEDFCTYTSSPSETDTLPINCLPLFAAQSYCESVGAQLLSEAQYEYVASGLTGKTYVWGNDPSSSCDDVVFGRGGWGWFAPYIAHCKPPKPPGGPLPVGSQVDPWRRDRLELEGGTVFDLVGNMAVYVDDDWNRGEEPCWNRPGVFVDPRCRGFGVDGAVGAMRGGSWEAKFATPVASRRPIERDVYGTQLGVRCARPDR